MVDRERLQEALLHVDQAAFALSTADAEQGHELAAALALLGEARALVTTAAFHQAARPPAAPPVHAHGDEGGDEGADEGGDEGPVLVRRVQLDGDLRAASAARAFAATACATWSVPAVATSTVVDLASELVSNAARHAVGSIGLVLERDGSSVLVAVSDGSGEQPRLLPYRSGVSEQGIGLRLVDQLSASWGWTALPQGKQVWARAAVSESPAPFRMARRVASQRRPSSDAVPDGSSGRGQR